MKKYYIFLVFMFLIGIGVTKAELYYSNGDEKNIYYNRFLRKGDIIDYSKCSNGFYRKYRYKLYLDDELLAETCFGTEDDCLKQYIVEKDMVFIEDTVQEYENRVALVHTVFMEVKEGQNVININPPIPTPNYPETRDENYYKSGDIILFGGNEESSKVYAFYIYDLSGNIIKNTSYYGDNVVPYVLPQIDGKDVFWYNTVFIDGGYRYPLPHFTPFEYKEPVFELTCDEDTLNYGDKTVCKLMVTSDYELSNMTFAFKKSDLRISNVQYVEGISNNSDDGYDLVIRKGSIKVGKKSPIMTFNVEGINDDNYLDVLQLEDIVYTDEVINAEYEDLNSDIKIKSVVNEKIIDEDNGAKEMKDSKDVENPNTKVNNVLFLLPVILLSLVVIISFIDSKKTSKYNLN